MHVRLWNALVIMTVALCGCATVRNESSGPALISGTVVVGEWTGWIRDWCGTSLPVPLAKLSGDSSCIPHGGELHRAYIKNAQVIGGQTLTRRLYVAYSGHAIIDGYEQKDHFVVLKAPSDFAQASGLQYIIGDIGGYDRKNNCIVDGGYSHLDNRKCPEAAYHEQANNRCVPLPEYMSHYASGS